MNDILARDGDPFGCDSVESLVRAACGYVQSSDDLRPRTLEAAREACRQGRTNFRFGSLALTVILLAMCGFPHWVLSSRAKQVAHASSVIQLFDLHREASSLTVRSGFDPSWAFYEAFWDLRQKQAELFGSAM
jgi:hypothetical protein